MLVLHASHQKHSLALALIENSSGKFLFHEGTDSVKNEKFYRPLGGGIEFGETGTAAVVREFKEELDREIEVSELAGIFENIFTFEGKPGHEIVLLYRANFFTPEENDGYDIVESGRVVGRAVWRSIEEIRSAGAKIYPAGIERLF